MLLAIGMWFIKRRKEYEKKNDVFSIFGEFVANKVRDLNSPRLQPIVQHQTHTVLLEAEVDLHNVQIHNEQTQLDL